MTKKGIFGLLIMLLVGSLRVSAQNQRVERLERLDAYRIAFFTKRLNLTSREAERFWPVYNEFQTQKNMIQVEKNAIIREFNQNENSLSEREINEMGDKLITTITQEADLAVTFHKKLKEVLPPAKVIRLYQVESQYRTHLLNDLQQRRQMPQNQP